MKPNFRMGEVEKHNPRGGGLFAPALMPEEEKLDLARSILFEIGVTHVNQRGYELIHSCPLPFGSHKNGDANASASFNYDKLTFNCLAAETLVKTDQGEFPISELAGGSHRILDGDGKWIESPIRSFGKQRLSKVTLSRNGVKREIYATPDHRWMVRPKGKYDRTSLREKTTSDLKARDRIPSVWPMTRTGRTTISPVGVMAGFVFGDGSVTEYGSVANFCGEKDRSILPYFDGYSVVGDPEGDVVKVVAGLPRSWKERLPDLNEGPSYLFGWLAGYFAADGCVADDGHVTLSCSDESVLRRVVAICDRLGIATYTLSTREREGFGGVSSVSSLSLRSSTLTSDFFLIPSHRDRHNRSKKVRKYERTNWWVVSVEETDRFEEVYCAEVSTTQSFVLEGNILTGNCLGCGSSGGLLWFLETCRGDSPDKAREWLEEKSGLTDSPESLANLLRYLDAVFEEKKSAREPIPKMDAGLLDKWKFVHPWVTDVRRIPESTVMHFTVGYGKVMLYMPDDTFFESERIVIPHFWKGDLVGWQTRRLRDDGTPKYSSSPSFPKDQTMFNHAGNAKRAIVVESPFSVLSKYHVTSEIEATFGAKVTDVQLDILSRHEQVTIWMDNDLAGWKATERIGEFLTDHCPVFVVPCPYNADPADLDDQTYLDLLDQRIPYALWQAPEEDDLVPWSYPEGGSDGLQEIRRGQDLAGADQ